jgi:hypothetical protein
MRFSAAVASGSTDCGVVDGALAVAGFADGSGAAAATGASSFLEQALIASNIAKINGNLIKVGCDIEFIFGMMCMVMPFPVVDRQKSPQKAGFSYFSY